ncbi:MULTISPECIES: hypothetical protein [unclassified Pseudoalteromonas]|uniref:hypothetical protein n=2 Tax=unclassified Pseudoalteromonas TaxID=194690 RepID=UPI000FE13FE1|nr:MULTISPECIES: hypothetical protein [unclassified Pseudoalteromonas]
MMTPSERTKAFNKARTAQLKALLKNKQGLWDSLLRLLELAEENTQTILQGQPTDWQQWHYGKLQGQINQVMLELGERSAAQIKAFSQTTWVAGINLIDAPLKAGGVTVNAMTQLLQHRQLVAIDNFMVDRIKDVLSGKADYIRSQLGLVMMGAQDSETAKKAIAESLGEKKMWRAKAIVNTELSRLYNTASHMRMNEIGDAVPGMEKEWRLGRRKEHRVSHLAANNTRAAANEPFTIGGIKMMHPHDPKAPAKETVNCSCFTVPVMKHWEVDPNLTVKT